MIAAWIIRYFVTYEIVRKMAYFYLILYTWL